MNRSRHSVVVVLAAALGTLASVAHAQVETQPWVSTPPAQGEPAKGQQSPLAPVGGYTPLVPVSELARPASWFDPSRLNLSTSVTVGQGFGGGTEGLQVTSLSYRFAKPLWMNVSVGNTWGPSAARNGSSVFLEGLDLGFRPFNSMLIQVHYRDMRSALQYNNSFMSPYRWDQ